MESPTPVYMKAALARPLLDTAAASGVDVSALLARLQMNELDDASSIPLADYFRLQSEISSALEDETLHLSKRHLLPGTIDFVMARFVEARSLRDAMTIIAQSYNLLHGGEFNTVRRRGDVVSFVTDDRRFPFAIEDNPSFVQFSIECVQVWLHCVFATVSRPHAHAGLRAVAVRRERRTPDAVHLDFWRAPIRFGAPVYALEYDYEAATARIDPPRAEQLGAARVFAEIVATAASPRGAGRGGETADLVRQSLARGVIDQTRIAAFIGVSAPTLRRRLEAEGTNFRELRQEVLNQAARRLLSRGRSVTQVAEELGFSDWRAFSRAFQSWNGVAPKSFARDRSRPTG